MEWAWELIYVRGPNFLVVLVRNTESISTSSSQDPLRRKEGLRHGSERGEDNVLILKTAWKEKL